MVERELFHSELTGQIIGAAIEVHRVLGPGFLESVYEHALAKELTLRKIPFRRQMEVPVYYKDGIVGTHVLDFLVDETVIVELKATKDLADIHQAIVLSYLTATQTKVALLLNFGREKLQQKRLVK